MKPRFVIAACALTILTVAGILITPAEGGGEYRNVWRMGSEKPPVTVEKPAPDFRLEGVVGTEPGKEFKTLSLKDFRDKWLVFFSTVIAK